MTLLYNIQYENYINGYLNCDNGIFIDGRNDKIQIVNPSLASHDADPIFKLFEKWFNPRDIYAPYSKREAMEQLEENIKALFKSKNKDFESYLKLKLYQYFLLVYSSDNTRIRENGKDVIELFDTIGYHPYIAYTPDGYNSYRLPERLILYEDLLHIFKSVLVQSCDVDSIEIAPSKYHHMQSKTILTSKFNPYETFYNYLLMDWNVQVIPKRIYNYKTQKFEEYGLSEFFVPDSELRLKEEVLSIKLEKKNTKTTFAF